MKNISLSNKVVSFFAIIVSVFLVVTAAQAATTIGTDISTAGSLTAGGASTLFGTLTVPAIAATSTTATSTFAGGFAIATNKFIVDRSTGFAGIGTASPQAYIDILAGDPINFDALYWRTADQISGILTNSQGTGAGAIVLKDGNSVSSIRFDGKTGNVNYVNNGGNFGIGLTNPSSQLQVANPTSNATTSVEIGKSGQNKGSCLVMYDVTGAVQYVRIQGGTFLISSVSCK